jgi:large subunit ribosomal protein L22
MTGPKTNERPGTKAVLRHFHMSAYKARQVLDLIRGKDVITASEILNNTPREAARVSAKVLASAIANAVHNDGQIAEDLYVSAAFADEGPTMGRWRPRARGRATRIRKRTCHITIVVDRMDEDVLARRAEARQAAGAQRSRRVAESQRRADQQGRGRRRDAAREAAAAEAEEESLEATTTDEVTTDEVVEQAETTTTAEAAEAEATDESAIDAEMPAPAADEDAAEADEETN